MKNVQESTVDFSKIETQELLKQVQSRGYFMAKTPTSQSGQHFKGDLKRWAGKKFKWGVVADTHLCSKYQQLTHLWDFYRVCARRRIDTVFHCGDILDGEKVYKGQEYELFVHGADAQIDYVVQHYPRVGGVKTKLISGNHDLSFMATAGVNVCKNIADKRRDIQYCGDYYATIEVDKIKVALMHGAGGVAYSRSYKMQKIAEQLSSENKPHFLFSGHWHVPVIIPGYRNIELCQMSCFQSQTPFLTRLGLQPFVAGLIVEIQVDNNGLAKVRYEWIPFYVPKQNDF